MVLLAGSCVPMLFPYIFGIFVHHQDLTTVDAVEFYFGILNQVPCQTIWKPLCKKEIDLATSDDLIFNSFSVYFPIQVTDIDVYIFNCVDS